MGGSDQAVAGIFLRHFSKFLCLAVLFLIFAGSLVTSHGAGLSVPDWPTTYGHNMFTFPFAEWRGNIFFEHGHRLIASTVGALTAILVLCLWRFEKRRWVRLLGYAALIAVVVQGVLGGLTVIFLLPTAVSVSHALLAQTFFILTIILAYSQSKEFQRRQQTPAPGPSGETKLFKFSLLFLGLLYLQLFLGALMRHTHSGLAIPDFPTMGGGYVPMFDGSVLSWINNRLFEIGADPVSITQVWIHFAHRAGAFVVTTCALLIGYAILKRSSFNPARRGALLLMFLVCAQFALGAATVLTSRTPEIASLHVVTGALMLGVAVLLALRLHSFNS